MPGRKVTIDLNHGLPVLQQKGLVQLILNWKRPFPIVEHLWSLQEMSKKTCQREHLISVFTPVLAFLYNISGAESVIDILLARLQEV